MNGASFALVANVAIAALFAASFAAIALSYRRQRAALWFCASYFIGMLTPLSELLVRYSATPEFFVATSYASFLAGLLTMAAGLAAFHGDRPHWPAILAILLGGSIVRTLIWGGQRDALPYELAYQLPFAAAALLNGVMALRIGMRRPLHGILAASFAALALLFMLKPFFAHTYGSGATARDYATSTYALFSQASTGGLLVAIGLLVLLLVVQKAVAESEVDAETDALAGITNRRGFDRRAEAALAQAVQHNRRASAVMFDIDRFKAINDTHGHQAGDRVIVAFADLLRRMAPPSAIIGRIGGEEFAMLLDRKPIESARQCADAIRVAFAALGGADLPLVSVSGGVAEWQKGESLSELMRRADRASYRAKQEGRDRICLAED
jgi:diguanylate cyclase (GGDEF)-like protein